MRYHDFIRSPNGRAPTRENGATDRESKMPRGHNQSNRRFGIEIEAFGPASGATMVAALAAVNVDCRDEMAAYNHTTRPYWKIVRDGSINMPGGFELVSPPLSGAAGLAEVERVCGVLAALRVRVSRECGLHVHVDATDLSIDEMKALVHQFIRYEGCFDMLVSPSRRANHYAASTRGRFRTVAEGAARIAACTTVDCLRAVNGMGRYHKLNLEAYAKYKTVEFRQHQGTIEYQKIQAWVGLVVGFVEKARSAARTGRTSAAGANGIRDFLKCAPLNVRPFLLARYEHFKARAAVETGPDAQSRRGATDDAGRVVDVEGAARRLAEQRARYSPLRRVIDAEGAARRAAEWIEPVDPADMPQTGAV